MEIVPPKKFRYAHKIEARFTKYDPKVHDFPEPQVVVNLRECSSVHPPAALWCAIFLLQWNLRGFNCVLSTPDDADAKENLRNTGLFRILQEEDVFIDSNHFNASGSPDIILPLTRFDGLGEAAELTNRVEDSLYNSGLGSANIHPIVCEPFSELVNNAAEHSESGIGAYGFVQFSSSGRDRRFMCGVADGGIGIRKSLERNLALEHIGYEWSAIELAVKELISGTSSKTRGIGLFSVFSEMRVPGRELVIHSGEGILTMSKDSQIRMIRANLFPGTMVYISVPT
jgi:hypothetical protein